MILDIVENELCVGCGICVSESERTLEMKWNDIGFLVPTLQNNQHIVKQAIRVCPFNPAPAGDVEDEDKLANIFLENSPQYDNQIGRFNNTYIGYSDKYRSTSSSGGIATYIFEKLLKYKVVDHLYIVKEVNGTYEYSLFSNFEEITKISKTRYIPVTLDKLFNDIENIEGKIAISGVACFIKAIRLKQHYHPELKIKIPFLIGIICGGLKSSFFSDFLAQSAGIEGEYVEQDYRIKNIDSTALDYSFGAFDEKRNFHQMEMSKVGDMWGTGLFKSNACDFCTDVSTELADISLGDAWLPEYKPDGKGNSIIITRSELAEKLIQDGILTNELHVKNVDKESIIESQKSSFSHRQDAVKFRLIIAKLLGKKTPYVRKRMIKSITIPYSLVQLQRVRTRKKSLEYWKLCKDIKLFNKKMKMELKLLSKLTGIYHKLRNI